MRPRRSGRGAVAFRDFHDYGKTIQKTGVVFLLAFAGGIGLYSAYNRIFSLFFLSFFSPARLSFLIFS